MLNKSELIEVLDITQLVPQRYADYRPLIMDGLLFFLEHLSPQRLEAIIIEQLQMPEDTGMAERLVALLHHCPTLHKLGQVIARDRRLAAELRSRLQGLESLFPSSPMAEVLAIIHDELRDGTEVKVASQALAEASVAVVVPFTWREPGSASSQEGVFKVLKPGVETRLQEELEICSKLGVFLEERCADYGLPVLDYGETLNNVRQLLLNEIRLDLEQAHLVQAAKFYAHTPQVHIPRLLPFSNPRMTAMERIYGSKVTETETWSWERRQRLARIIAEALIAKPFWNEDSTVAIHADPHAGNLFVTTDGQLAVLDWSLVASLNDIQRRAVMQIVLGAVTLDETRICQAVAKLGRRPPEEQLLQADVAAALQQVRWGAFPGFNWLLELLDRLAISARMGFPEDLVLFRKALLTLSGVINDVCSDCSIDQVLLNSGLRQFLYELPNRGLTFDDAHTFGTHISNADLLSLWACLPISTTRLWLANWHDMLRRRQAP